MADDSLAGDREATYLGLRLAMPVLVLLLGAAIVIRIVATGCVQPSISAYYYTPVRPVFVGVLCALGACLVLYRGRPVENAFLNFSGFLAFIVAFVPTGLGTDACDVTNRPDLEAVSVAVRNNVAALSVAAAVALVLGIFVVRVMAARREDEGEDQGNDERDDEGSLGPAPVILTLVLAVGLGVFFVAPDVFRNWGHLFAAVALFIGIMAVVVYSWRSSRDPRFTLAYRVIAALMVVTALLLLFDFPYRTLVVEAVLILLFAAYWIVQTVELEDRVSRGTTPTPVREGGARTSQGEPAQPERT